MAQYAAGKYAYGSCDRCSFRYPLSQLQFQVVDLFTTGFRVCPECLDAPQPQYQLGDYPVDDPVALRDPRPPLGLADSRRLYGWNPIGGWNSEYGASDLNNMVMEGQVGRLTITTN